MKKIITAINIIIAIYFFILANLFFWLTLLFFVKLIEALPLYQLPLNIIFAMLLMGGSILFFRKTRQKYLYGITVLIIIWIETSLCLIQKFGRIDPFFVLVLGIPFGIPLIIIFFTKYFDKKLLRNSEEKEKLTN